jgi:hypothetical protein
LQQLPAARTERTPKVTSSPSADYEIKTLCLGAKL